MRIYSCLLAAISITNAVAAHATVMCQTCERVEDNWNCVFTAEQYPSSTQCNVFHIQKWDKPDEYHFSCVLGAQCALNGASRIAGNKSQCLVKA